LLLLREPLLRRGESSGVLLALALLRGILPTLRRVLPSLGRILPSLGGRIVLLLLVLLLILLLRRPVIHWGGGVGHLERHRRGVGHGEAGLLDGDDGLLLEHHLPAAVAPHAEVDEDGNDKDKEPQDEQPDQQPRGGVCVC
jgi:hypothetical protein